MLSPRSVAVLGIGHGARQVAALGLWLVETTEKPPQLPPRRRSRALAVPDWKPLRFRITARGETTLVVRAGVELPTWIVARGATRAKVRGHGEAVGQMRAMGVGEIRLAALAETPLAIPAVGKTRVDVRPRGESTPVFSDEEVMALAIWRRLH